MILMLGVMRYAPTNASNAITCCAFPILHVQCMSTNYAKTVGARSTDS